MIALLTLAALVALGSLGYIVGYVLGCGDGTRAVFRHPSLGPRVVRDSESVRVTRVGRTILRVDLVMSDRGCALVTEASKQQLEHELVGAARAWLIGQSQEAGS